MLAPRAEGVRSDLGDLPGISVDLQDVSALDLCHVHRHEAEV
jgi:hypothetical protein